MQILPCDCGVAPQSLILCTLSNAMHLSRRETGAAGLVLGTTRVGLAGNGAGAVGCALDGAIRTCTAAIGLAGVAGTGTVGLAGTGTVRTCGTMLRLAG